MSSTRESLQNQWGWVFFFGILLLILGTLAIVLPLYAGLAVALTLGWLFMLEGIFQIIHAFRMKIGGGLILNVILGLLGLAAGILLLIYPMRGLLTLTLFLTIFLVAQGIFRILLSLQLRRQGAWGWLFFGGLLSLALGIMIYAQWPSSALWIIGLFIGIDFIFTGWSMIMASMTLKQADAILAPA